MKKKKRRREKGATTAEAHSSFIIILFPDGKESCDYKTLRSLNLALSVFLSLTYYFSHFLFLSISVISSFVQLLS